MKFDNKDDIPEGLQDKFVERDGVWMSQDLIDTLESTKKTLNEVNELRSGNKELSERLAAFEASENERKEKERKEAEAKMTESEKRQLEDERRANREQELLSQIEEANNKLKAIEMKAIEGEQDSFANRIKDAFGVADGFGELFVEHYKLKRTKVVDGEFTPTNEKGEAVDKDIEAIVKTLESDKTFSRMKAAPKSTPSLTNGANNSVRASQLPKGKKLSEMSKEEKLAYHRQKLNVN